jgi:hypothetical protein
MPLPINRSPEFEVIPFSPDQGSLAARADHPDHLLTSIGLIRRSDGTLLTFDTRNDYRDNTKLALLPEATVDAPFDERAIVAAIPIRFGVTGGRGRIVGTEAMLAQRINHKQTPRLYVPVIYTGLGDLSLKTVMNPDRVKVTTVWRSPEAILETLEAENRRLGLHGAQRRGIARTAVLQFLES